MSCLTPDQLPEYCDRLGKEIKKAKGNKERKIFFKLKSVNELIDWRECRPNLSSDYFESAALVTVSADSVPAMSQEHKLVGDLLPCFLGSNTDYILADSLPHKHAKRIFRIIPGLDPKLHNLCEKCLVVGTCYSQLCRFIEDNRFLNAGRVNQALGFAMDMTLEAYKSFVVDLQDVYITRGLSLQELYFHIQDTISTLELLCEIAEHVTVQELRGAATLSYLHRLTIAYMEPPASHSLLKYLTKNASAPYFQSIKEWIFNGIIFDPFEEFMITEKPRASCSHSSDFWEKRYHLKKVHIPSFLESATNEIFKSGAYLNVIKEGVSHDRKLNLARVEAISYSSRPSKYLDVISRAYIHSSSYLLTHMLEEYQLLERFTFMRKYLLIQQGEFIAQILDTCDDELCKPIKDIIPSRMQTLVDMAIRGVEDSIRDDLNIVLQPQDLCYQVSKILSVASNEESCQKSIELNTSLSGFECFTLNMACRWPISLIFNARIISCYQMIFRLLFYCKHVERLLSKVWILDQRLRKLPPDQMHQYSGAFALRHKMIYFIQNMQYYMMEEAIEPNWIEFQLELKKVTGPCSSSNVHNGPFVTNKVKSIDDLIAIHKRFLDKCMNDCLLTNALLFPMFKSLLAICKDFVTFIVMTRKAQKEAEFSSSLTDVSEMAESTTNFGTISELDLNISGDSFAKTIYQLDEKFQSQYILFLQSIAELSCTDQGTTKISEILRRANFNFYFTSMLEK
ncbi:gamma-tubulin complex component 2-like isoform X3 [Rhodnius prolixus]